MVLYVGRIAISVLICSCKLVFSVLLFLIGVSPTAVVFLSAYKASALRSAAYISVGRAPIRASESFVVPKVVDLPILVVDLLILVVSTVY